MKKLLVFFLLVTFNAGFGQTFRFNEYSTVDGLAQNFIYTINQDKNGYLWIGTGEGLSRFDGKEFTSFTSNEGLAEDIITASQVDENGNIWFGHNEGGLTFFNKSFFEIITAGDSVYSTIKDFCTVNGTIYFISQNQGLHSIQDKKVKYLGDFGIENFICLESIENNRLLIGSSSGVSLLDNKNGNWEIIDQSLNGVWVSDISSDNKTFLLGTQTNGLFRSRVKDNQIEVSKWEGNVDLTEYQIKSVFRDKHNNIWLSTQGGGLQKIIQDPESKDVDQVVFYNTSTGLQSDFIQTAYEDREGNIWIGTFGNGISTLIDDYFTFYNNDVSFLEDKNIYSFHVNDEYRWYGSQEGLIRISNDAKKITKYFTDTTGWIKDAVVSLEERNGILWIGTNSNGLYSMDLSTQEISEINWNYGSLQKQINQITSTEMNLYVATNGGLIIQDLESGEHILFDTESGLAHNAIKALYVDDEDVIWIGTHSRYLYSIDGINLNKYEVRTTGELEIVSIDQDELGSIWIATAEAGVYKLQGDQFIHFGEKEGLKTNYCYAIKHDVNGNIWVGHRGSLSKVSINGEKVITYDYNVGIKEKVNKNAIYLDNKNHLWFGTDHGPIRYNSSNVKANNVAPVINLSSIIINGEHYPTDEKIHLPYGKYRVLFSYIGISFRNSSKVTYQYKLNGYDEIFGDPTKELTATYGRLTDGDYEFEVVACNEDGFCSPEPLKFRLSIAAPIWKKWWFYFLIAIGIGGIIYFVVITRLNRIKKSKELLEIKLEEKTKEVVEKAETIQEINKDLTSSINYAKRIQGSLLPNLDEMKECIPKSFVYFKPRDIVSGDFYYVDKCGDKLIIGCVDCTGHGVPGGFMSMIGSVTLRNIYLSNDARGVWETPEKILEALDKEIESILKQNVKLKDSTEDFYKSRDGMDMSLAEVDLKTGEVLLSSAMRTSLLFKDGELETIAGTKRPIGGGDTLTIPFELVKIQLNQGDGLYLFSDGYTDQFGGPKGRKLKLSGVKEIVKSLANHPSTEHERIIKETFENWLSDFDQIDDVLFMGIEF